MIYFSRAALLLYDMDNFLFNLIPKNDIGFPRRCPAYL